MERTAQAPKVILAAAEGPLHDQAEYVALRELRSSDSPRGCWRIHAALQSAGVVMSEASAGRLLRRLDMLELTEPVGLRGHVITEKGQRRIAEMERARERSLNHSTLSLAISPKTAEDLLDLLRARRLIEAETARLAALNATDEELSQIELAVGRHISATEAGSPSLENNHDIHRLIAQASHSRIYEAIVSLFIQDTPLHETQNKIQRAAGMVDPTVHETIATAIREHNPDQAAAAMQCHIDLLIEACRATLQQNELSTTRARGSSA